MHGAHNLPHFQDFIDKLLLPVLEVEYSQGNRVVYCSSFANYAAPS